MTAGCIVLAYNLPEVTQPVRLSRAAYVKTSVLLITGLIAGGRSSKTRSRSTPKSTFAASSAERESRGEGGDSADVTLMSQARSSAR